jgi:AraC family transcriptional regulator of adaptative response/methylated-DNA-[protein]-cysteine methyltransferase
MNATADKASRAAATERDPRWADVVAHNPAADGDFFYSVASTGVYCRPSCSARLPRPENVAFHNSREAAEAAGFRPCLRCRPGEPPRAELHAAIVTEACRIIEESDTLPDLETLAQRVGMSRFHFHRVFRQVTGVTPRAYATAHRTKRVRAELDRSETVTQAIFDAGYNSNGPFYAKSNAVLGMTPRDYRNGGTGAEIRFAIGECSLGSILVAQSEIGICAILLGNDPDLLARDLQDRFPRASLIGGDTEFEQLVARVVGFVETPAIGLDLPLDVRGTAFQQRVWEALREIPVGETASYSAVAARIGAPGSVRAVAQACGANALAVAIPCHRVVRSDGSVSGYRWGVERKIALLDREAGEVLETAGVDGDPATEQRDERSRGKVKARA